MDSEAVANLKKAGLEGYFDNSYGWAWFKSAGKGAFIIGLGGGKGEVYAKKNPDSKDDAVLVGTSVLTEASAGWSLGMQVASQIIFFEDEAAFNKFAAGDFGFSVDARVACVDMAADSSARTPDAINATGGVWSHSVADGNYKNGMATFVALKVGVMFDLSVSGQKFAFKPV
eukprot:CAMPEP_0119013182 /NCGR_PEP_ID=MMETSP1176-20130426/8098_1 /TAXON_ID=265551 /ORGANISM="Synedropsis recta cf, Strain CCMP1620" /LENGTH=171 /DNA_ID=CAMNT_0006966241 /DNA_START=69 /DNA_END=584 /DNA_ORIENTATION=+